MPNPEFDPNFEVLEATYAKISKMPRWHTGDEGVYDDPTAEYWVQETWNASPLMEMEGHTCGTAGCFAGWVYEDHVGPMRLAKEPISVRARKILGLDYTNADHLFTATNSLEDIRTIIDLWRAGYTEIDRVYEYEEESHYVGVTKGGADNA